MIILFEIKPLHNNFQPCRRMRGRDVGLNGQSGQFFEFFCKICFHCLSNMAAKRPLKFQDAVMKHYRVKGKISILEHYISNQNSIFNSVKFEFFGFAHANFFNVFFFNMRSQK